MYIFQQEIVERLCQRYLGGNAQSVEKITGFQADVYLVQVGRLRAVLKCYRQSGQAQNEAAALDLLRQHANGLAMPEVIAIDQPDEPGEALVLTFIDALPASHVLESPIECDHFAADCAAWLQSLHRVSNDAGFQDETGQWHADFASAYQQDLLARVNYLQSDAAKDDLNEPLLADLIELAGQFASLPVSSIEHSSLIHGEAHAANFLVNEQSHRLCAVIDPYCSRFTHCELDLLALDSVRSDLKILHQYLSLTQFDSGLPLRLAYFAIFSDVLLMQKTGVSDEAALVRKIAKFKALAQVQRGVLLSA